VVFDGALVAAGDENHLGDARFTASSTAYWISGLSTMGSISLGCALVAEGSAAEASDGENGFGDFFHGKSRFG
jgi:hypothetical protein